MTGREKEVEREEKVEREEDDGAWLEEEEVEKGKEKTEKKAHYKMFVRGKRDHHVSKT